MSELYLSGTLREVENRALSRAEPLALMSRAAAALAEVCTRRLRQSRPGLPIIALVGPGNNGADALLAALMMRQRGFDARALVLDALSPVASDAAQVRAMARSADLALGEILPDSRGAEDALFIDGLFGIGLSRPLQGRARQWVDALNDSGAIIIAADVPSGLDANTGSIVGGAQGSAIRATATVTFIGDKPGLHTGAGTDRSGHVYVDSLRLDPGDRDGTLLSSIDAVGLARPLCRVRDSHKGSYGQVGVLGGIAGMQGASLLAALGAQHAGAGKVFVVAPEGRPPFIQSAPQLMTRDATDGLYDAQAIAVGCGLGQASHSARLLALALACPDASLVIDADALTLLSRRADLRRRLAARKGACVLTPHPLEAARLLGTDASTVQSDRIAAAKRLARRYAAIVVLKGSGSVIASPSGEWAICSAGSASLASAGTGDVLAGLIAGLMAQGLAPAHAACLGVWVHARAGEAWAETHAGETGLSAGELPLAIRSVLNHLTAARGGYPSSISA